MTAILDESAARKWLLDYLVTTIGCSADDIDFDAPLSDLGVGSRDAVTFSGEVSELFGRPVSPVEFWQYPTINALVRFLTGAESEPQAEVMVGRGCGTLDEPIAVIGLGCRFPGGISRSGIAYGSSCAMADPLWGRCRRIAGSRSMTARQR